MLCMFLSLFINLLSLINVQGASISNPHLRDDLAEHILPEYIDKHPRSQEVISSRKFFNATPIEHIGQMKTLQDGFAQTCHIDIKVKWMSTLGSSIFASPVIFPGADGEGESQIAASTFYDYIELMRSDGYKPLGWPLSLEGSSFQGSPLLYDIDGDGINDIGLIDKDANFYWIRIGDFGQYLEDYHVQIPKLKVKKNWYIGLDDGFADRYASASMFDHNVETYKQGNHSKPANKAKIDDLFLSVSQKSYPDLHEFHEDHDGDQDEEEINIDEPSRRLQEVEPGERNFIPDFGEDGSISADLYVDDYVSIPRDPYENNFREGEIHSTDPIENHDINDIEDADAAAEMGYRSFDDGFHYYMNNAHTVMQDDKDVVFLDPHVLGSAAMVDVDGDGHMEILVAVSYYFDEAKYAEGGLPDDVDPKNYIAGGLACWDLENQEWGWLVHLDLTTTRTQLKALIYSSPTIADLDGDGRYEVLIGTSLGLLYILDGESGFVRRYFPMQFHEIQAQIAVGDLRGGPDLEIVVADMAGNLVMVTAQGEILWDLQLAGALPHTPTFGDVNGDGQLDVIVAAVRSSSKSQSTSTKKNFSTVPGDVHAGSKDDDESYVYAVDAMSGKILDGYPIMLPKHSRISSPIILADLHDYSHPAKGAMKGGVEDASVNSAPRSDPFLPPWLSHKPLTNGPNAAPGRGLHLIIPSFDGHIYILSQPKSGFGYMPCTQRIDVGEHIYSTPLLADISKNGKLDLLVGTLSGNIYTFETNVSAHPANTWTSFPKHRGAPGGFTHGSIGISIPEKEKEILRHSADIRGRRDRSVSITFDIWDTRDHRDPASEYKYTVVISRGTNKHEPMAKQVFDEPGRYTIDVYTSPPEAMVLVISLTTEHGLYYEDTAWVSVSTRFYVWIKYLPTVPALVLCLPLLFMQKPPRIFF